MAKEGVLAQAGQYCPICGRDVPDTAIKRFGQYLCSEEHAEEFVREMRAQRMGVSQRPPESAPRRQGCC
ncbi:MAG: hypothetical protein HYY85_22660 [Deltaproteobacteria bacterium]|nr:hypothetical protein [Deltaproteobacteria bacterium]